VKFSYFQESEVVIVNQVNSFFSW